jgi:hypothetical protein
VIARLAARFKAASLFVLEEIDQFGNDGLFNPETFETGVTRVKASEPRRLNTRGSWTTRTDLRLDLNQSVL